MTASSLIEYYRQFAFVSSVLAGFSFGFYGVLLSASAQHRTTNLAALLAVMASVAFLLVTLGMTFASAIAANLPNAAKMPSSVLAQQTPLSFCFLFGIALLFGAFGLGGGFGHALWVSPRLPLPCWVWSAPSLSSYLTFIKSTPRKASNETLKHVYREQVFDVWAKREAKWQWDRVYVDQD